jgi:hypothetical protein
MALRERCGEEIALANGCDPYRPHHRDGHRAAQISANASQTGAEAHRRPSPHAVAGRCRPPGRDRDRSRGTEGSNPFSSSSESATNRAVAGNINNDHTRRAYARACSRFFAWCEKSRALAHAIRPFDVAAWVKDLQQTHGARGVKQQLAAVRMLFDWLITGQIVPMNPAAAVRGPKHVVKTGKTPVLEGDEWRKLLASIPDYVARSPRPQQSRIHHAQRQLHCRAEPNLRHSRTSQGSSVTSDSSEITANRAT